MAIWRLVSGLPRNGGQRASDDTYLDEGIYHKVTGFDI